MAPGSSLDDEEIFFSFLWLFRMYIALVKNERAVYAILFARGNATVESFFKESDFFYAHVSGINSLYKKERYRPLFIF